MTKEFSQFRPSQQTTGTYTSMSLLRVVSGLLTRHLVSHLPSTSCCLSVCLTVWCCECVSRGGRARLYTLRNSGVTRPLISWRRDIAARKPEVGQRCWAGRWETQTGSVTGTAAARFETASRAGLLAHRCLSAHTSPRDASSVDMVASRRSLQSSNCGRSGRKQPH
jgi:hypothetical protein